MSKHLKFLLCLFLLVGCSHLFTKKTDYATPEKVVTDEEQISTLNFVFPVKDFKKGGGFVWRRRHFHKGVDLLTKRESPIYAIADGKVIASERHGAYGNRVIIQHHPRFQSLYAHNLKNLVKVGDEVKSGQVIALVGRTGRASANHVHFEILFDGKAIDPLVYLETREIKKSPPPPVKKKKLKKKKKKTRKHKDEDLTSH